MRIYKRLPMKLFKLEGIVIKLVLVMWLLVALWRLFYWYDMEGFWLLFFVWIYLMLGLWYLPRMVERSLEEA